MVAKIDCWIRPELVPGFIRSLRVSEDLDEEPAKGEVAYSGVTGDQDRIQVNRDGTFRYDGGGFLQALVTQSIKGILPSPPSRYLLGFDESGIGGGSRQPTVALVMISSDARARLLAQGIRDAKRVGSDDELDGLCEAVRDVALSQETVPIPEPKEGEGYPQTVAKVVGGKIRGLLEDGFLTQEVHIRVDQVDEGILQRVCGDDWSEISERLEVATSSEQHAEVAAASLLAKEAARDQGDGEVSQSSSGSRIMEVPGTFLIGRHRSSDEGQILEMLEELELSYPDIQKWIEGGDGRAGIWDKVENGEYDLLVARAGDTVAGFSLSQQKDSRNAKISTFYVRPRFQGQYIGQRLLQRELFRYARKGLRRVFVTFGHEHFEVMQPFFSKFGFSVDGISPQRYRDNSYEVVMGKRFSYETIDEEAFASFIRHTLFRMEGYDLTPLSDQGFLAVPKQELFHIHQLPPGRRYYVRTTTRPDPEAALPMLEDEAETHDAIPILASLYGFPATQELPDDTMVFDAYALENRFYPLQLDRPASNDVILPIKPEFAKQLFPTEQQATFALHKLGLRPDNVFYRAARGGQDVRRGSRLFFYATQSEKKVIGSAKLRRLVKGQASKLHGWFGGLGAWKRSQIEEHTGGKEGLAYVFEWFNRFDAPVSLSDVRATIPKFNPITAFPIDHAQGDDLLRQGMDDEDWPA